MTDDPLNPGLEYVAQNNSLSVAGVGTLVLDYSFRVSTLSGASLIKDSSLILNSASFQNSGTIDILETVFLIKDDPPLGSLNVFLDTNNLMVSDEAFFEKQSFMNVDTIVLLDSSDSDSSAVLSQFTQRFSQESASTDVVPEPASVIVWSLFGAMGVIAGYRRKPRCAPSGNAMIA